jgi:hypothetical protein
MTIEELEQKVLSKYGDIGMSAVCFAARMLEEQSYDGIDCIDKIQELSYLSNEYCNEDEEDYYDEDEEF